MIKYFNTMILLILIYGCEIWDFQPATYVEATHLNFLKHLLELKSQRCYSAVYWELGRAQTPLTVKRKEPILNYSYKISYFSDTLLNNAYVNVTRTLENDIRTFRINNFASEVKYMLNQLGFAYLWYREQVTPLQQQKLIERLHDQYLQI